MEEKSMNENKNLDNVIIIVIMLTLVVVVFNTFGINSIKGASITGMAVQETTQGINTLGSNAVDVIPKGIPDVYGKELGVSFDDISAANPGKADATIKKLGVLDQQITLTGDNLERYIDIASKISCEYCCGAESIIFENGQAACGCAHSYAMRGLAKYLIKEHGAQFSDDEILEEMGKWKTLFFPGQITQKASVLKEQGIELNYINLASNKYRGIEQGATGNMVGGC